MSYTAQATSYSRHASAATRRAEREAHMAQDCYLHAAQRAILAARLTQHGPAHWYPAAGYTPAALEAEVRTLERLGDSYLRSSFSATDDAAHYRQLAASHRDMHARRMADLAELERWHFPGQSASTFPGS